jgi:hypothetical protein
MATKNGTNGNGRIEFLKQKLAENRAALAAAVVQQARSKQRDDAKLDARLGRAVRQVAARSPEFHAEVKTQISAEFADESPKIRRWLTDRGWLCG